MIKSYEAEIKSNTECATVEVLVDGTTKVVLGICRYIEGPGAEDKERPSADSFETIASNRIYGYFGNGHDVKIVKVDPIGRALLEQMTGVDWYTAGAEALEQDEWAKVISKGSDPTVKAIADFRDREFIEDEVDEI